MVVVPVVVVIVGLVAVNAIIVMSCAWLSHVEVAVVITVVINCSKSRDRAETVSFHAHPRHML